LEVPVPNGLIVNKRLTMSNSNKKPLPVEVVQFELGGVTLNGYSAGEIDENEKVINYLSGQGLAESIGATDKTTRPKSLPKELKAFLGESFTPRIGKYKNASGAYSKINLWTTDAAAGFYTYHAIFNQNPTAIKILQSLSATTLDIIINDAFDRKYEQFSAQEWTKNRFKSKDARMVLTDAIKWYKLNFGQNLSVNEEKFLYVHVSNKINIGLFGKTSQKIKQQFSLGKNDLIRDYLEGKHLLACISAEELCSRLIYQSADNNGFPKPKELADETIDRLSIKEKFRLD